MKLDPQYCGLNDRYYSVSLSSFIVSHLVISLTYFPREEENSDQISTIGLQITYFTKTICTD